MTQLPLFHHSSEYMISKEDVSCQIHGSCPPSPSLVPAGAFLGPLEARIGDILDGWTAILASINLELTSIT